MGNIFSDGSRMQPIVAPKSNADSEASKPESGDSETSKILDYPDVLGSAEGHNARRHLRSGYWVGPDIATLHSKFTDSHFAEQLPKFLKQENCSTAIDIGAGNGVYSQAIANSGIFVNCYDGNPNTQSISQGRCGVMDFSQIANLPCQYDWVLSIKVGKHIPREFEETFFQNMHRLARKGVVINWGGPTEMTPHTPLNAEYFNQRSDTYLIEKFTKLGYVQDIQAQETLRSSTTDKTLRERLLVFRKVN